MQKADQAGPSIDVLLSEKLFDTTGVRQEKHNTQNKPGVHQAQDQHPKIRALAFYQSPTFEVRLTSIGRLISLEGQSSSVGTTLRDA